MTMVTMMTMRKGSNTSQRRHFFIFFVPVDLWMNERTSTITLTRTHTERETSHTHTHSQEIDHVLITAAPSCSLYITLVDLAGTTRDDYASSEQERLEEDHRPIVSELQREVKKKKREIAQPLPQEKRKEGSTEAWTGARRERVMVFV